jgi:hypothetical protein
MGQPGLISDVYALAVVGSTATGRLYAGGNFATRGVPEHTTSTLNYVAWFDDAGSGKWEPLTCTGGGIGVNSAVRALAEWEGDLILAGGFTTACVGGATVAVSRIARWNHATSTFTELGAGLNGQIMAIAVDVAGGRVFAGGYFTKSNTTNILGLAVWNATDDSWAQVASGYNPVFALALWDDGATQKLVVGGGFTYQLAVVDLATNVGETPGSGVSDIVHVLATNGTRSAKRVIVGGEFIGMTNNGLWPAKRIGTYGRDGANALTSAAWPAGGFQDNSVKALLVMPDGTVYAGGAFSAADSGGGTSMNNVAFCAPGAAAWTQLKSPGASFSSFGVSNTVNAMVAYRDAVVIGGVFGNAAGFDLIRSRVAMWNHVSQAWM